VSTQPFGPWRVTISAGICDLATAGDAEEIFRLADGALYWSKAHGRDVSWIYDPEVVRELSAEERANRLERSQALLGLRALARAIDAKDPVTREHSERVAALAARLAEQRGWDAERVALLSEAALLHDVGKIGVPDELLVRPGPLTPDEMEQVRAHAALSAEIVDEVLLPEQVEWIRAHHERPDGQGYPNGLGEGDISEGAALLAVADAWDVMTRSRPYSAPKPADLALAELQSLVGRQFCPCAFEALVELAAANGQALTPVAPLPASRAPSG
jgi:putative nucleotidyltransferase with HDIG domain